jgi:hypothetical protein
MRKGAHMEALLEITGSDSMAVIEPTSIVRPIVPRTRLVHKAFEENVLLSHIDEVARGQREVDNEGRPIRKDHFRGTQYIQRNHTFFFEHHRDHVPGLYLIEAGRQMSVAVAHRFYDVPCGVEFVMTDLHVWFRNMANIHDPLIQHIYRKGQRPFAKAAPKSRSCRDL